MQAIAQKAGFSETAFVLPANYADFQVRFFTPVEEVPLCGHATIATLHLLKEQNLLSAGNYQQETKAGVITVQIHPNHTQQLALTTPEFLSFPNVEPIAKSLNITTDDFAPNLVPQIVSTGLPDVIIPIKNLTTLHQIMPNFEAITTLSETLGVVGYHLFCLETIDPLATAHCRNLAPLLGIPEESATGTANGALAAYLFHHKVLPSKAYNSPLVFEQGYTMGSPSEIQVALTIENKQITALYAGGKATIINTFEKAQTPE